MSNYPQFHLHTVDNAPADMRVIVQQDGYIRQRQLGGTHVLRLLNPDITTIDAWFTDCTGLMRDWGRGKRLRYLHDIRSAEKMTPHAIDRAARILELMRVTPVSDGRGAVLANNAAVIAILQTTLRTRRYSTWQIRVFQDEAIALRWLAE